jgi:hypothetical protein
LSDPSAVIESKRNASEVDSTTTLENGMPWKVISTTQRMQFTCEFKQFSLGGRLDFKGIKSILKKLTPGRLCLVRGSESDCNAMVVLAKSCDISDVYAPHNRQRAEFLVTMQKLQLRIPRKYVPTNMKTIKAVTSSSTSESSLTTCTVCLLEGKVSTAESQVVRYMGQPTIDEDVEAGVAIGTSNELKIENETVGVISMGEVAFSTLKRQLEAVGMETEIRLVASGTVLVCADQVLIRKDNNNFTIEGPPVPAFFEARKALYQQFAFI